jgi:septum formation protein
MSTMNTALSSASSSQEDEANSSGGSLLVSAMHRISLTTDDDDTSPSTNIRLLLASQSPRRREILDMMGLSNRYTAQPSPLDETALQLELSRQDITPQKYARTLAERKAHAMGLALSANGKSGNGITLIIGSDTIVDLEGSIMEKPNDEAEACSMLRRLSGNWHEVHTGVAVYGVGAGMNTSSGDNVKCMFSFTDTARVKFATLSDKDIQSYVDSKEPMDKAGSYGIQGIGGQLVESMVGDFFTVMGLPMHRLSRELSKAIASLEC